MQPSPPPTDLLSLTTAHTGPVQGLAYDGTGSLLVSGSRDGTLAFWGAVRPALVERVQRPAAVVQLEMHRDSGLLAVVCVRRG